MVPERHKGKVRLFARTTSYLAFLSAFGSILASCMVPAFEAMEAEGFKPSVALADMGMPEWVSTYLGTDELSLSPLIGIHASYQLLGLSVLQFTVGLIAYRISR